MLGLHNIFLISPPPQQQNINNNNNIQQDDNQISNNNNNNNPWNLKSKAQELGLIKNDGVFGVCRDCGNRAKKECGFRRCRTCCKTRGYDCVTHVKSTWVPASTRREKKAADGVGSSGGSSSCGGGAVKRQRLADDGSYFTCTSKAFNFDSGSYHQDAGFKKSLPSQVFAPATFRCIRVTAISNDETEVVYQATVNISGHVFKGFLYNKGIDEKNLFPKVPLQSGTPRDSSSPIVNPNQTLAASNDPR